jgi:hypothetical protein
MRETLVEKAEETMKRGTGRQLAAAAALAWLCGGCLDLLGHEEDVIRTGGLEGMSHVEDDRIEDKHPAFDPARTVTERFGGPYSGCGITMNKSAAVTKLDIVPFEDGEEALDRTLFRGRTEALAAISAIAGADAIPSMEVVNGALKPFNDGLYAAVELAVEAGKRQLFDALASRLLALAAGADAATRPAFDDAQVLVGAAQLLAGDAPALDAALASRAQSRAAAFQANTARARPTGFYTWSPALERIFTRDRFLQNRDDGESFGALAALAWVLGQDAALLSDYQRVTALYAGLTNPYLSYPVDALIPFVASAAALADPSAIERAFAAARPAREPCVYVPVAFLPASRSKEVDFFERQFCAYLPEGTSLLDALLDGIRSGAVDLAPGVDAGWYDYQLHALETLLLPERGPESQNLLLTAGYKKKLVETFKSILIETRETHVKQLGVGARAASGEIEPVDAYPLLPAEPFPTFTLRTARAYRFLRTFLQAAMGPGFLAGTQRLIESGARGGVPLASELDARVALLYGLAFVEADAIGMDRAAGLLADELAGLDVEAAVTAARGWLASWKTDPDVSRDPRVIVPVFTDPAAGLTTYWAVVGVKALVARAEFVAGHEPVVTPTGCWTGKLLPHRYTLLVEESAEVTLPASLPPPTRDELRAICDAHATTEEKDEIVRALGSR